ncbi:DNA polymerase IV [Aliivibrio salmonicida]|uniref:DNA polymerase IV n=1 Tax=Aliivibrio salmonicida (strain LFI1238) TaxID=316275 RepID=B6EID9_ALISL|nr:DNA polymerase IV [Aliivibrio salmonicida]AZL84319.1 DNA polymerase IV [Aliivibrio salmonicida]CAQ78650.1 DNA polymerase IV [Aliivibrio salmonicida LFI1238]
MSQKIIHIDLDCYYAAVEARDNPELRGIPIAIGGSQHHRGVLSTCNYEAREFGVRSAMSTAKALQLCPNLTVVPGNMDKYKTVSKQIHKIFSEYTDLIEPLSLDEAYLDVTDSPLFHGSATLIAEDIRKTIWNELQLTASAGVAPLKFIAKVASDVDKPNGICVVPPNKLDSFIEQLELGKISGVGKVTLEKLHKFGFYKGQDIRECDHHTLLSNFGKFGQVIWERCNGIDNRKIETNRTRKSVGVERTFQTDIYSEQECIEAIEVLYPKLIERLQKSSSNNSIIKQGLKLKFQDFKQTTIEHKKSQLDKDYFLELLREGLKRQQNRGIRLIGISIGLNTEKDSGQINLF